LVYHEDALAIKFPNDEWRIFIFAVQSPTFDTEKKDIYRQADHPEIKKRKQQRN
jgi:hypothetical protein